MNKLANKHKVRRIKSKSIKKYVLYTIGEILIIIIGIYIALQFDQLSIKNKNEKYIKDVLRKVEFEAKNNIRVASFFLTINSFRDSASIKILKNKLTVNDYLHDVNDKYNMVSITQTNFENELLEDLNKHLDYLNESDKKIYNQLKYIEIVNTSLKKFTENAYEIVAEHKAFQKKNHDWFYQTEFDSIAKQKEYNYRISNFNYKNYVKDLRDYEIINKSSMLSYVQALSAKLLLSVNTSFHNDEKLNSKQIDSILHSTNLLKLDRSSIDSLDVKSKNLLSLFDNKPIYTVVYNSSKDTITIQDQNNSSYSFLLPPEYFDIKAFPCKTTLKVFINDSCITKYQTKLNSYLFYE